MIHFNIDMKPHVLLDNGQQMTLEEYEGLEKAVHDHDFDQGFKDRMSGYYDKWYRYGRKDEGKHYDRGVMKAVQTKGCRPDCYIIENEEYFQ